MTMMLQVLFGGIGAIAAIVVPWWVPVTYQSPPSTFGPGHRLPLRSPAMKGCDAGQIVVTDSSCRGTHRTSIALCSRHVSGRQMAVFFFDSLEIDE